MNSPEAYETLGGLVSGETKDNIKITSVVSPGCDFCVTINVNYYLEALIIYLGSLQQRSGDNYLATAAHETNHIQAAFKRMFSIVSNVNREVQICKASEGAAMGEAINKKEAIKKLLNDALDREGNHKSEDGFGTPGPGAPGNWTGKPGW